jgi:hypothetical protein
MMFSGMLGSEGLATLELAGAGTGFFASQITWTSNTGRAVAWASNTGRAFVWNGNTGRSVVWVSNV